MCYPFTYASGYNRFTTTVHWMWGVVTDRRCVRVAACLFKHVNDVIPGTRVYVPGHPLRESSLRLTAPITLKKGSVVKAKAKSKAKAKAIVVTRGVRRQLVADDITDDVITAHQLHIDEWCKDYRVVSV